MSFGEFKNPQNIPEYMQASAELSTLFQALDRYGVDLTVTRQNNQDCFRAVKRDQPQLHLGGDVNVEVDKEIPPLAYNQVILQHVISRIYGDLIGHAQKGNLVIK